VDHAYEMHADCHVASRPNQNESDLILIPASSHVVATDCRKNVGPKIPSGYDDKTMLGGQFSRISDRIVPQAYLIIVYAYFVSYQYVNV